MANLKTEMPPLNEEDTSRIKAAFEHGAGEMSREDLEDVLKREDKAIEKGVNLKEQFENFKLFLSLCKDYWAGEYKDVPWKFISSVVFAIVYLLSAIDIIPDFIPILGFADDAAVFALVISSFQSELDAYKKWKEEQKNKKSEEEQKQESQPALVEQ